MNGNGLERRKMSLPPEKNSFTTEEKKEKFILEYLLKKIPLQLFFYFYTLIRMIFFRKITLLKNHLQRGDIFRTERITQPKFNISGMYNIH